MWEIDVQKDGDEIRVCLLGLLFLSKFENDIHDQVFEYNMIEM